MKPLTASLKLGLLIFMMPGLLTAFDPPLLATADDDDPWLKLSKKLVIGNVTLRAHDLLRVGDGVSIGNAVNLENARVERGQLHLGLQFDRGAKRNTHKTAGNAFAGYAARMHSPARRALPCVRPRRVVGRRKDNSH